MRRLTVTAVLLAFLLGAPTALAAVKPPKPPKPPKVVVVKPPKPPKPSKVVEAPEPPPAPEAVTVTVVKTATSLDLLASGLTPGDGYDFTFQVWETGETNPYYLGGSTGALVRDDGTFRVSLSLSILYAVVPEGSVVRVVVWLRPPGSAAADVASADGTLLLGEYAFT